MWDSPSDPREKPECKTQRMLAGPRGFMDKRAEEGPGKEDMAQ